MRRASFACRGSCRSSQTQSKAQHSQQHSQQLEGANGGYTPGARGGCRVQGAGRDVALRHREAQAKEVFCSQQKQKLKMMCAMCVFDEVERHKAGGGGGSSFFPHGPLPTKENSETWA